MAAESSPFTNLPPLDWSLEENRNKVTKAFEKVRRELGKSYPAIINGKPCWTGETIISLNPANYHETVGVVAKGDRKLADEAIEAAGEAWKSWRKASPGQRAEYLFKAAELMCARRFELLAWVVLEAGKNWKEADADVAEAVDFLEYYGKQMLLLGETRLTAPQIPAETNSFRYTPRGIGLVLGIWNFPCAINAGMSSASIVAGNTAVFKPASLTPVTGYKVMQIFQEAGLPDGVLNYLPGAGREMGEYLTRHAEINFIVFTGSREAGLRIDRLAAEYPHRNGIKKRVLETGGKNAIIIDGDADLDEAIRGTIASWLGAQGQKCSACSRLIVMEDNHDYFVERLIEAAKSVPIGDPQQPGTFIGPMISRDAQQKVQDYIEIGEKEGRLLLKREVPGEVGERGYYAGPAIFTDVSPQARIAQEEIFGPVLAVIKVRSFDEALEVANATGYALTGGIYSRSTQHIRRAEEEFDVGNFYVNRSITGAIVGRQPFGGHRGSGTGPKAGGPEYLKAFMNEKTISENIMRRGFAPLEGEK